MPTDIIVPCRNEAGEIESLLKGILDNLLPGDKLIVVEGGSYDSTWTVVSKFAKENPTVVTIQQSGTGKFDAVITGVKLASQDYVMIWDADGTVAFQDNLKIYNFHEEETYIITGDRLKGSREVGAMQFFNLIGNFAFALIWGLILKSKPIDSLCGTKKFPRKLLLEAPNWLLNKDPYGDFTLLGMAFYCDLSVRSIPVNYAARKYGKTNIHRWSGGWALLKLITRIVFGKYKYAKK